MIAISGEIFGIVEISQTFPSQTVNNEMQIT